MEHHALWLVAINTLLHEIGVPLPLMPTLLVAGAEAMSGGAHPLLVVAIVIVATLLGNSLWFAAGRRYGLSTLKFLCRISLSADSCVTRTERSFGRWGGSSIVVGRFIPGASLLAPPLAGALGMSWSRFISLSAVSAALWGLIVVGTGMLLHRQLGLAIRTLDAFSHEALATIIVLFAVCIAWLWWKRARAAHKREVRRITVDELNALIDRWEAPVVVDVRASSTRRIDRRRIPGAIALELQVIEKGRAHLPREREVVLYCACRDEATAAHAARLLRARGYGRVRALLGGLEAWVGAGYAVDVDHGSEPVERRRSSNDASPRRRKEDTCDGGVLGHALN